MARLSTSGLEILEILDLGTLRLLLRISGSVGFPWGRSLLSGLESVRLGYIPGVEFTILGIKDSATLEARPVGDVSLRARAQILRAADPMWKLFAAVNGKWPNES